jgi:hypothetical protein
MKVNIPTDNNARLKKSPVSINTMVAGMTCRLLLLIRAMQRIFFILPSIHRN